MREDRDEISPAEWRRLEFPVTSHNGTCQMELEAFNNCAQTEWLCTYCLGRHRDRTYNLQLSELCKKAVPSISVAPQCILPWKDGNRLWLRLNPCQAAAPLFPSLALLSLLSSKNLASCSVINTKFHHNILFLWLHFREKNHRHVSSRGEIVKQLLKQEYFLQGFKFFGLIWFSKSPWALLKVYGCKRQIYLVITTTKRCV